MENNVLGQFSVLKSRFLRPVCVVHSGVACSTLPSDPGGPLGGSQVPAEALGSRREPSRSPLGRATEIQRCGSVFSLDGGGSQLVATWGRLQHGFWESVVNIVVVPVLILVKSNSPRGGNHFGACV